MCAVPDADLADVRELFGNSKLPLSTWFQAMYLVTQNENNLSALSLKRHLGVSHRNALRIKHKLLEAIRLRPRAG